MEKRETGSMVDRAVVAPPSYYVSSEPIFTFSVAEPSAASVYVQPNQNPLTHAGQGYPNCEGRDRQHTDELQPQCIGDLGVLERSHKNPFFSDARLECGPISPKKGRLHNEFGLLFCIFGPHLKRAPLKNCFQETSNNWAPRSCTERSS